MRRRRSTVVLADVLAGHRPMFLVIARAAAADDPGGPHVQVRYSFGKEPAAELLAELQTGVEQTYLKAFGQAAARVGVGVVPWVTYEDDDRGGDEGGCS